MTEQNQPPADGEQPETPPASHPAPPPAEADPPPYTQPYTGQYTQPYAQPQQGQPPAYGQPPYGQAQPSYPAYGLPPEEYEEPPDGEERTWALMAHIGTLVTAWFALGIIAPLITLFAKGNTSPFVRRHSVESLNFQISLIIYSVVGAIVGGILTIVTIGLALLILIPLALVIGVALLVFVILATVKASNGEEYRYPFTLRLVS